MWKKYFKNAESPIIDGPLSEQPDREHGNPIKPNRNRDVEGIKLGKYNRRQISANFPGRRSRIPPIPLIFESRKSNPVKKTHIIIQ